MIFSSFYLRQVAAAVRLATIDKLPDHEEFHCQFFNNIDGEVPSKHRKAFYKRRGKMLPFKGEPFSVPLEQRDEVCVHITSIAFGVSKYRRAFWLKEVAKWTPEQILVFGKTNEEAAMRLGLHERFWEVPYHWVGLLNGDILHNNPSDAWTFHGDLANRKAIGVAAEGSLPGLEKNRKPKHHGKSEIFIETNRETLRLAVTEERKAGCPLRKLTAHRQYNKARQADPGELYWKEVVLPMKKELDLTVDYTFREPSRGGMFIPRQWDPDATASYY